MATLASPDFNTSNPSPFSPFFPDQVVTSQERKDISSIYIYFACLLVLNKRQPDRTTFLYGNLHDPRKGLRNVKVEQFCPPKKCTAAQNGNILTFSILFCNFLLNLALQITKKGKKYAFFIKISTFSAHVFNER